jgi:serine/threonine protein kinase
LNHPNICALHDVGSQNGIEYLVMECVEGESLAQRLEKGPLPVEQVVKVGKEIADALDKAHRSGIIHRDLKPGNIMLNKSGSKLLDFGLARPVSQPVASLATLTATGDREQSVTQEGSIVGTFQYMAPEQVEGKELDGRSDVFSMGAVLYEMVTGQWAFQGRSQLSVASAILEKEPPPISNIKPLSPRGLEHIIRQCMAKDPDDRWQTARDVALELASFATTDSAIEPAPGVGTSHGQKICELLEWGFAALLLLTTAYFFTHTRNNNEQPQQSVRTSILPPEGMEFDRWSAPSLSPDGKFLVFSAAPRGFGAQLWIRPIDSLAAKLLLGTKGAEEPFWSPDSRWIAFFSDSKLKKISVDGGLIEANISRNSCFPNSPTLSNASASTLHFSGRPPTSPRIYPSRRSAPKYRVFCLDESPTSIPVPLGFIVTKYRGPLDAHGGIHINTTRLAKVLLK